MASGRKLSPESSFIKHDIRASGNESYFPLHPNSLFRLSLYYLFCAIMASLHMPAPLSVIPISAKGITIHPTAKANTLEINLNFSLSFTLPSAQSIRKSHCLSPPQPTITTTKVVSSFVKSIAIISSRLVVLPPLIVTWYPFTTLEARSFLAPPRCGALSIA